MITSQTLTSAEEEAFRNGKRSISIFCGIQQHDPCAGDCFCDCHLSQHIAVRNGGPNVVTLARELHALKKPEGWLDSDWDEYVFDILHRAVNSKFASNLVTIEMLGLNPDEAFERIAPSLYRETWSLEDTLADIFGKTLSKEELIQAFGEDLRITFA